MSACSQRNGVMVGGLPRAKAQYPTEFEVASIRRTATTVGPWSTQHPPGGLFSGQNLTAKRLILQAFNLEATEFQLVGVPTWTTAESYDMNAKVESPDAISPEHLQVLLRSLLASRFALAFHRESKELPIYALTAMPKNGTKLRAAAELHRAGRSKIGARTISMLSTCRLLSSHGYCRQQLGFGVVVDETGMAKGAFDFRLTWTPDTAVGELTVGG